MRWNLLNWCYGLLNVLQGAHIHKYRYLSGSLTDSERCPNWGCSSGCYYLHTEAHWENVWKLLLIMLSVTNQPWPLSPQDTHAQTYGCDDNFWGIHRYKQPFSPQSLVWCADLSTPAGTLWMLYRTSCWMLLTALGRSLSRLEAREVLGQMLTLL